MHTTHPAAEALDIPWGWRQRDVQLFRWMRAGHRARPWLLRAAKGLSHWGWLPLFAALCAMAWRFDHGVHLVLSCVGAAGLAQVACKRFARRWAAPRPFALGLSPNHLHHGARAGFPSTHAVVMGSVAGFMALAAPADPLLAVIGAMALATAWARVYAGAHFPSDVLAGLGLGLAWGSLAAGWWV